MLDNRISAGKFGYEVLGILQLDQGGSVLVNRGWIAGDSARLVLPQVPEISGEVSIKGHIYVAPGKPYLLEEQRLDENWPKRIQAVEGLWLRTSILEPVSQETQRSMPLVSASGTTHLM